MNFVRAKRYQSERGVILPISAIVALSVVVFLFVVGLNSFMVKRVTFDLRERLKIACQLSATSENIFLRADAASIFQSAILSEFADPLPPHGRVQLTSVSFIFPQLPENGVHDSIGGASTAPQLPGPVDFAQLTGVSCQGITGDSDVTGLPNDCQFYGSVIPFRNIRFPDSVWRNDLDAKGAVGCVAEATLERFILSDVSIVAVASFSRPLHGHFPEYFPGETDESTVKNSMPGLVLAVSTHVTTRADDLRFRFSTGFTSKDWYDPFENYTAGAPALSPNMYDDSSVGMKYESTNHLITPERISPNFQSADWSSGTDTDLLGLGGIPDYEEMLVACANPLLLVRNAFLSSFLEYAIRFGRTRSSVELLHIGTQHRNVADIDSLPAAPNAPSIIAPFGSDMLAPQLDSRLTNFFGGGNHSHYQLPYVFFHGGSASDPPPADFGHHKGGYIAPFGVDDANPDPWQRHQALIAGQLRICYHLYQCDTNSGASCGESIARFYPNVYFPQVESLDYEPRSALHQLPTLLPTGFWEQTCPFEFAARDDSGATTCKPGGGTTLSRNGISGLQAPELVGILGSTQLCPYEHLQPTLFTEGGAGGVCEKPGYAFDADANYTLDLRPDYLGLVQYLSGSQPAVRSPGLAALKASPTLASPLVTGAYQAADNLWLPLVLVTHQLPTAAEAAAVEAAITSNSRWFTRPISVVFFPYTQEQFRETEGLDRLRQAFLLDDSDYQNSLFIFDPDDAGFARTPEGFRRYWESLIDPSLEAAVEDEDSVAWRAARIFNQLLAKSQEKF